jgi:hypothetical protein
MSEQDRKTAAITALLKTGGNVTDAARHLGYTARTLYRYLHQWGLMGQEHCHVTSETGTTSTKRDIADIHTRETVKAVRHEVADRQDFSLTAIRAGSTLSADEMSIESILTGADKKPPRRPSRVLSKDQWETLTQRSIELSSLLKKPVTMELLLSVLVDKKLPELVDEVVAAHEQEQKKGGQKK